MALQFVKKEDGRGRKMGPVMVALIAGYNSLNKGGTEITVKVPKDSKVPTGMQTFVKKTGAEVKQFGLCTDGTFGVVLKSAKK